MYVSFKFFSATSAAWCEGCVEFSWVDFWPVTKSLLWQYLTLQLFFLPKFVDEIVLFKWIEWVWVVFGSKPYPVLSTTTEAVWTSFLAYASILAGREGCGDRHRVSSPCQFTCSCVALSLPAGLQHCDSICLGYRCTLTLIVVFGCYSLLCSLFQMTGRVIHT